MTALLKVEKLKKSYGKNLVLDDLDLSIEKGDIAVVIGPSGSGKSTFLRCLNLLEKKTSGHILFNGEEIKDNVNLHQKIGMVFQSFNLFTNLTVYENIVLAPVKTKLLTKKQAEKKALSLLKNIGLQDKLDAYPDNLSGGERQRVAIIRSLIMEPEILLFDEPTSALDPEMIAEVLNLIKQVAKSGTTMIVVTHELSFAREIANKIIFIDEGKIIEQGPPEELFSHPKTKRLQEFLSKIMPHSSL